MLQLGGGVGEVGVDGADHGERGRAHLGDPVGDDLVVEHEREAPELGAVDPGAGAPRASRRRARRRSAGFVPRLRVLR